MVVGGSHCGPPSSLAMMAVLAGVLRPYDPVVWSSIDLTVTASTQVVDASRSLSALPFWLKFALGLAPAHPPPRGRASLSYFEAERSKIDENWFDNGFSVGSGHRNRKGAKPTGPWRCAGVTLPTDLVRGVKPSGVKSAEPRCCLGGTVEDALE